MLLSKVEGTFVYNVVLTAYEHDNKSLLFSLGLCEVFQWKVVKKCFQIGKYNPLYTVFSDYFIC